MAAKPEAKEPVPDKAAPEKSTEVQLATKAPSGLKAWIPAVAAVVLAPVASLAVAQFVLLPRLQKKLAAPVAAVAAEPEPAPAAKAPAGGKEGAGGNTYDFTNVVVNLSGSMGTRYLKTTFTVTGTDATIKQQFESNKAKMTDVALNVLSALSLTDLEEPGSKNVIRDKLVASFNQAFGHRVVEQVYFGDFLIQ